MFEIIRNHPFRTAGAAGVLLAGLAWVAFGYFGVHTLFVDDVVSEAAPVFDTPATVASESTAPAPTPATTVPSDPSPAASSPSPAPTSPAPTSPAPTSPPPTSAPATTTPPEVVVEYAGDFVDESRYSTSGQAIVLGNGTGQRFLRFEDFATDNGPDLNVYLVNTSTGDVSDFVDLGDLTGNIGDQNYEIPADVDLEVYDRVVIWCVRFGVGFGSASLTAA